MIEVVVVNKGKTNNGPAISVAVWWSSIGKGMRSLEE